MNDLDLDLNNYTMEDIFNLFKIPYSLSEQDLKYAYKKTLKTHPDKSGLPPEVYIFYNKAYEMLSRIYYFRHKKKTLLSEPIYVSTDLDKDQLNKCVSSENKQDFNKWFNKLFNNMKVTDDNTDSGYAEWYHNYVDKPDPRIKLNEFDKEFNKLKTNCKSIQVMDEVRGMGGDNGYDLNRTIIQDYSSEVFSDFIYEDLKKAHTITSIPVTDYNNRTDYKTETEYKNDIIGISHTNPNQSEMLRNTHHKACIEDTQRIFSILRRDECIQDKYNRVWGGQMITNDSFNKK
jgi:hypothetical protein